MAAGSSKMFDNVKLLQNMSALANHAEKQHALIAENIANSDTPGFKAREMQPFSEVFAKSKQTGVSITAIEAGVRLMETADIASPNGNTVSLEQQTMLAKQSQGEHELALLVYRKAMDMMKMAIGKNA
jgi:flagellar basal-body rod protein FlgB